jgi:hypothetical protein
MPQVGPIRLTAEDHSKLMDFVKREGRNQSEILREAVNAYVDGYHSAQDDQRLRERDKVITDALKAMENRFAVLLVRLGIDMESMYALAWSLTSGQPDRTEMFEKCYQVGVARFRRRLKGLEREMADALQHQGESLKPKKRGRKTAEEVEDED